MLIGPGKQDKQLAIRGFPAWTSYSPAMSLKRLKLY